MVEKNTMDKKFQKELNSGTIALVLLSTLEQAPEPMYGYQIAGLIGEVRDELPSIKQGVLYPVLRSMQSNELLESFVEPSVSGPPRRYYKITDEGRSTLERWKELWYQTKTFVDKILEGENNE